MKIISMHKINKIKGCQLRIFEAEDDDYPDRRIISANERAIDHYLKYYFEEQKQELLKAIRWNNDDCSSELVKLGWTVTGSGGKMEILRIEQYTRIIVFRDDSGCLHHRKINKNNTFICKGKKYEVRIEELENE